MRIGTARSIISTCGYVGLNTTIAVFGPVILETRIRPLFHPQSGADVVWRELALSIVFAASLGLLAMRFRTRSAAKSAWVIPAVWFSIRSLAYTFTGSGAFFSHFSGYDCEVGLNPLDCADLFGFTVPLLRGVAYSGTARLYVQFSQSRIST